MFHIFTDITMFLALVLAASVIRRRPDLAYSSEMQRAGTISALRA